MYAVIVEVTVKPGSEAAFWSLITENARLSREQEAGCHQFDVCRDGSDQATVLLYELYTDRAAFDAHLQTGHFRRFDEASAPLIAGKRLRTFTEVRR